MQSYDYIPNSKKNPKMRYYPPSEENKITQKQLSLHEDLCPSVKWTATHCIPTSKILSTLFTEFPQFFTPITNYFTMRKWKNCAKPYILFPSLHWVLYLVIQMQTNFCKVFLESKISLLQWPQCWQMPPKLEAEQDFK